MVTYNIQDDQNHFSYDVFSNGEKIGYVDATSYENALEKAKLIYADYPDLYVRERPGDFF